MEERERLLQELDHGRARMRAVLAEVEEKWEVYPQWTIRHFVAHLAGWDDATVAALRAHQDNDIPPTPAADRGIDYYNSQSVAERAELTYEQTVEEWELARDQLKELLRALPDEKYAEPLISPWGQTGTVSQLVRVMSHHEEEHAEDILKLRGQTDPSNP